jgi:uncharacterized protein (TIGR00255 family)
MLLSMTGFGEAHRHTEHLAVAVEVRTINSRHFKLSFRSGDGYSALEPQVEVLVRKAIRRGTVQLNLRVVPLASTDDYRVNVDVLRSYLRQLEPVIESGHIVAIESLLPLPGVIDDGRDETRDISSDWSAIEPVVIAAIESLGAMRRVEGEALASDLAANAAIIAKHRSAIENRAPHVQVGYRERLVDRINKALSDFNVTVEPADLVREIALYVDRSDISEEIVRLGSHLKQFDEALVQSESTGRKLEFIAQEMGREINTIGSKANDTEISGHVVEMKTALERIREQVQNVE